MAQKIKDEQVPSRALLTLPQNLCVKNTDNEKMVVIAKEQIASGTQFGPVEAPLTQYIPTLTKFPLKIFKKDGSSVFLNTADEDYCNWMCLVAPASNLHDQNTIAYQLSEEIYFSTQRTLESGKELRVGYAPPYGKKMEIALAQTPKPTSQSISPSSSPAKEMQQVKRKRGRPPKNFHGGRSREIQNKNTDLVSEDLEPVDEAVVRSLGPKELGIKEDQQEWQCSQCSAIFTDALDFAKHLQEHYKPAFGVGRSYIKARGRGRGWSIWGQGRSRGRPRGSRHNWSYRRERPVLDVGKNDIENGAQECAVESAENPVHDTVSEELSKQIEDINSGDQKNLSQVEPISVISLDPSLNASSDGSQVFITSSSTTTQINVSSSQAPPLVQSHRGRKRKSEMMSKDKEDSYNDKHFRCVLRQSSESAAQKYNLRTTRKALVYSDDEADEVKIDDDIFDDDDDDDDEEEDFDFDDDEEDEYFNSAYISAIKPVNDVTCQVMKSMENTGVARQEGEKVLENSVSTTVRPTVVTLIGAITSVEQENVENKNSVENSKELIAEKLLTPDQSEVEVQQNEVNSCDGDVTETVVNDLTQSHEEGHLINQHEQLSQDGNSSNYSECASVEHNNSEEKKHIWETKKFNMENLIGKPQYHRRPGRYKCDLCGKGFNKTLYLFRHIKKHTGEFTCSRCHRVFARKENMLKHNCPSLIDTAEEKKFEHNCWYCNKSFGTDRMLKRHMAKHTGVFTCKECNKSYSTKDILLNHACPMRPRSSQFKCSVCGKTFTKHNYLLKHFPVHTGQHACPICGKWLRSIDSLTNHMRMCGQVKEIEANGKASCPNCHEVFTDVAEFRRHQYEHTHVHGCDNCGARFRNLVSLGLHVCQGKCSVACDVCNKLFTSITNMQRHKLTHNDPSVKCSDCGKGFFRKDALLKHSCEQPRNSSDIQRRKKKVSLMPLICEICGSMFSSTSSLNVHKNLHGEKKYCCDVCGKRFHRKDLLLEHHAVHGDPTFPCTTCNKLFKTKKSLDVHMMIHDGIKRFKCATCGKEFFQKGNLQKHEETHNNERKYSCTICQKSFSTKEYLRVHILEHTWGRIYSCGICSRSFVKEHQLRSHHRMFHSNQTYICKYCGISLKLRHSLKRHLKKKHGDFEEEWKSPEAVNDMLVTKEQVPDNTTSSSSQATELHLHMPDLTSSQGAEVLLAVAGIDNEEIREALATGRAQIKQGSIPNTIEISVPAAYEAAEQVTNNGDTDGNSDQIILASLPTENTEVENPNDSTAVADVNVVPSEIITSDHIAVQITDSGQEDQQATSELVGTIPSDFVEAQYQIELPVDSENNQEVEQQVIGHIITQNSEFVKSVSEDHPLSTHVESGQQIVISGQDLPEGTHHILLNPTDFQQVTGTQNEEALTEGTIVLEDGTIIQPEGGDPGATDLLLYVLTTSEQQ